MWGELHEEKSIVIKLEMEISAGKANRLFKELGATLHYDVYSFDIDEFEIWQSESLLNITLKNNGVEVDGQENFNEIIASYPFASRPSSDQSKALDLVSKLTEVFEATAFYNCIQFSMEVVQSDWDNCNDFLLKEWGEEPGSESLRIMIEENYA
ncbi:hypothetical protein [uncultured Vibrio sp.]|uniref:hypothetical protein n=1 Tax=uncultured Vibrio sp. TaxID=114054 RepID=UPI0025EF4AA2|nr:hypothetical protein [uncultured Vibrio sp.]